MSPCIHDFGSHFIFPPACSLVLLDIWFRDICSPNEDVDAQLESEWQFCPAPPFAVGENWRERALKPRASIAVDSRACSRAKCQSPLVVYFICLILIAPIPNEFKWCVLTIGWGHFKEIVAKKNCLHFVPLERTKTVWGEDTKISIFPKVLMSSLQNAKRYVVTIVYLMLL